MNTTQELTYLLELASLCEIMLTHAERIEDAAKEWHDHEAATRAAVRLSIQQPGAGGDRGTLDGVQQMVLSQGAIWLALDGFLASWARASLFLWPAPARHRTEAQRELSRARGEDLRAILEVKDDHPLNDRDLRNDWMHYDERLDDALTLYGRVTPQRFLRDGESEPDASLTMRLFDLTNLYVLFANERRYSLRSLFDAVRDLQACVKKAMDSMPVRRRDELLAEAERTSY
jgi:hypothetical protein